MRRLAYEAADAGLLSPELAAGIHRVKGVRKLGSRLGNWLTAGEASALWQSPDDKTLTGKRNRAILAILLGCGLRRELAELMLESLQRREERWAIVDLNRQGKTHTNRSCTELGERDPRCVVNGSRHRKWPAIPMCLSGG